MTSPTPKFVDPARGGFKRRTDQPVAPVKRDPDLDPKPKTKTATRRRKVEKPESVEPEPTEDVGLA